MDVHVNAQGDVVVQDERSLAYDFADPCGKISCVACGATDDSNKFMSARSKQTIAESKTLLEVTSYRSEYFIATTSTLALARVQRDAALSPTIALQLSARLDRLADQLRKSRDDWSRGLAALLKDREALDKAVADPRRLPQVPPGMPIGMDEDY